MKRQTNTDKMRRLLENGAQGTPGEFAAELGISRDAAYYLLRRLEEQQEASRVDTRKVSDALGRSTNCADVWGAFVPEQNIDTAQIFGSALASRSELERAWIVAAAVRPARCFSKI